MTAQSLSFVVVGYVYRLAFLPGEYGLLLRPACRSTAISFPPPFINNSF